MPANPHWALQVFLSSPRPLRVRLQLELIGIRELPEKEWQHLS
jgi:hypothetical protein